MRLRRFTTSTLTLLGACAAAPDAAGHTTAFLLTPKTHWFGVYIEGHKAGWSCSRTAPEVRAGRSVVVQHSEFELRTQSEGVDVTIHTVNEEVYSASPPFEVLATCASDTRGAKTSALRTERVGSDLRVSGDDGRVDRWLTGADYGLTDAFAVELWLRSGARPGDRREVRVFDLNNLRIGRGEMRFVATRTAVVAGIERTWHEFERAADGDSAVERECLSQDGRTVSWALDNMELRAEPPEHARQLEAPLDLDLLGRVRCDVALGDPRSLRRLVLRARGRDAGRLADGPGQRSAGEADGAVLVTVEPSRPGPVALADEVRQALAENRRYLCRDDRVQALARHGAGSATDESGRVRNLLAFVAAFVGDSYTECDHASALAVMESKQGDCSDHALLFTTLCRAIGVPARTVLGLAYQGDATQAFGPHEWCEVVLEGRWVAVDPTFAQLPADAGRLRLGQEGGVSAVVAGFSVEVVQAER